MSRFSITPAPVIQKVGEFQGSTSAVSVKTDVTVVQLLRRKRRKKKMLEPFSAVWCTVFVRSHVRVFVNIRHL